MPYTDGQAFGLTINDVRRLHPNKSIPEGADLSEFGLEFYADADPPSAPAGHTVAEVPPVDGVQAWAIVPLGADDLGAVLAAKLLEADAERDRRGQFDFDWDFSAAGTQAIDDDGNAIAAGVRSFQMRDRDQRNWQALQSQALAVPAAQRGAVVMPMRAEDNWNVQTTAAQVLEVTSAMFQRNAGLLFFGGKLKTQARKARAAEDAVGLGAVAPAEAAWPS